MTSRHNGNRPEALPEAIVLGFVASLIHESLAPVSPHRPLRAKWQGLAYRGYVGAHEAIEGVDVMRHNPVTIRWSQRDPTLLTYA